MTDQVNINLSLQLLRLRRGQQLSQTADRPSGSTSINIELIKQTLNQAINAAEFLPSEKKQKLLSLLPDFPPQYAKQLADSLQREQIRFENGTRNLYNMPV